MDKYIDMEAAVKTLEELRVDYLDSQNLKDDEVFSALMRAYARVVGNCINRVKAVPVADVVERDCFDRLLAENDDLRERLRTGAAVRTGKWVKARGSWCTPGGDPVWECSECGKGRHVYGIEHGTYGKDVADGQWVACPNCGAIMEDG